MKRNKILLTLMCILAICLLCGCEYLGIYPKCNHVDENSDNVCDECKESIQGDAPTQCVHVDDDNNGVCDKCGEKTNNVNPDAPCVHEDSDNNGVCDKCNSLVPTKGECNHADVNNDGVCDECGLSVLATVDILSVNDLHGKFLSSDNQPGVGGLSTYIQNQREQNPNTVLISSGDMWQGSAESGLTFGNLMTNWMNQMDFDGMALGNHEFDWGGEYIEQNSEMAEFPLLAINVYSTSTNQLAKFCQPSTMVDFGNVQVGIIGAIGDCYSSISGDMSVGYFFKTGSQLTQLVKQEATSLRDQGADIIVYSLHDGANYRDISNNTITDSVLSSYYDVSLSEGYVDIVFEGHSHSYYVAKDSQNVYHLQGGGENQGICKATLNYNTVNRTVSTENVDYVKNSSYGNLQQSPVVESVSGYYPDVLAKVSEYLGTSSSKVSSGTLTSIMARLYAEMGEKQWPSYKIVLGGGKLNVRSPYNLYAGEVTYGDLYLLFPFNNKLALCAIKGSDLKSRYINNSEYVKYYTSYGQSILNSVNDNETYYIIADSYNYTYAKNKLTVVQELNQTTFPRDLMADYVKSGGFGKGVNQ